MKLLKKRIILILALALAVSAFSVTGFAQENEEEDALAVVLEPAVWGDLDGDGSVTANDARSCLRAAAMLENLTDEQQLAADIFGNGAIDASNARKILRVAAKLDIFDCYTVNLAVGEKLRIENLRSTGSLPHRWHYQIRSVSDISVEHDTLVEDIRDIHGYPITGGPSWCSFTFTPAEADLYHVKMEYTWYGEDSPLKEFAFVIEVEDS